MAVSVPVTSIRVDPTLQPRVGGLDAEHVKALEAAPEAWPPLAVVNSEGAYLLVDGFHRLAATQNLGLETVDVEVADLPLDGDLHSLAFALNARHGRPLSLVDRRMFAERLLRTHADWADREIGRRCGLSSNTVGAVRDALERAAQIEQTPVRVGAGGYQYSVGTNERQRKAGELPDSSVTAVLGDMGARLFSPAERVQQRKIAQYLTRLSIALQEQDEVEGWNTAEDAAEAVRLVLGPERAASLADALGYSSRNVLDVAFALGYREAADE